MINGGRYNPPDSFPALYLCLSLDCVVAEFERLGSKHPAGTSAFLPREVYEYSFEFQRVLDLSAPSVLRSLRIARGDLMAERWDLCRSIGEAAHTIGFQAIRAPSVTEVGDVLCVFLENVGAGSLIPRLFDAW